ncbi:hypothetical protein [Pseudomonas sp. 31 R 17]|jgi:hypothetical protein|uniref:hypothetical protein n=1 Tax=unclassified Pseudomonas TaxID=196821 RepID=UPI0008121A67|nr:MULTISPECIES: hypothetical protein [unclassified Pseudomonas]CRM11425.1 hypothetical protein [Pseudomonas sp. 28 E 9]CRM14150.1 hypothetical protein [Pseudomonas sp. 31 R 17]
MIAKQLKDLPEVFVPFETIRADGGEVIYRNGEIDCGLSDAELLSEYSYIVSEPPHAADYALDKKVFFAERYGGDGLLNNGGGGRCGFDGRFHSKGIGPNPLVGIRPPDGYGNSHANGFLSLNTAVYESIWAEIIHLALPYGAVRSVAIIDLRVEFEEPDERHPRGLLVRMPAVRPAHFIRAIYYKEKKFDELSEDAKRVKAAVNKLVAFLPQSSLTQPSESLTERLGTGLDELAKRYARQFAVARAKRIFHQSISASNVTLEGAWMDLAGATAFSERMWWEGFTVGQFTTEYLPALGSIQEMGYYLGKYKVVSPEAAQTMVDTALASFSNEYEVTLSLYTAVSAGFPLSLLEDVVADRLFLEFSTCLSAVLAFDTFEVISLHTTAGWQGYEYWAARLYIQLLKNKSTDVVQDFSWACSDVALVRKMVESYDRLFELLFSKAQSFEVRHNHFVAYMAMNITRLNRRAFVLELAPLRQKIAAVNRADPDAYPRLFNQAVSAATLAFCDERDFTTVFWASGKTIIRFNALDGRFYIENESGMQMHAHGLHELDLPADVINDAVAFYADVEALLNA